MRDGAIKPSKFLMNLPLAVMMAGAGRQIELQILHGEEQSGWFSMAAVESAGATESF